MTLDDRRAGGSRDAAAQDGHPDAMQLAEYAEGLLAPAQRAVVERHLAECADCRDLVVDAAAYAAEGREATDQVPTPAVAPAPTVVPFRRRKLLIAVTATLAAAAALVLAIREVRTDRPVTTTASLRDLAAQLTDARTRPTEGRLSGGLPYGAAPEATRAGEAETGLPPAARVAIAAIEREAVDTPSPEHDAALGVAYLVGGDIESAITTLTRACAARAVATCWSDLAAAHLARGNRSGTVADYEAARSAADRALALDAALPEAAFNRAAALDHLGITAEARAAWLHAATLDPSSPWADEARRRGAAQP